MSEVLQEHDGAGWITDVLWPGATLSSTSARRGGAAADLVAVPHAAAPTQLLPARWTSLVAVANRPSDDRPRSKALRDAAGVGALLALSRVDRRRRVTVLGDSAASFIAHLRTEIDPRVRDAVILCGPARANRKPVLQLHDARGRTLAYVKVAWNDLTRVLLGRERAALDHLASGTVVGFQVPRVLGSGRFGAADWLALGPVGVTHRSAPQERTTFEIARAVERTADEWRGPVADNPFVARVVAAAATLRRSAGIVQALARDGASDGLVLRACHGDFVPWNTLTGSPAPAVWDWERYEHTAPIGYDRFHHLFQVALFRRGAGVSAAIDGIDARLGEVVPELGVATARLHLEWYLADLLCRYEHDATPEPGTAASESTRGLMARVDAMATVMEQRRSIG